MSPLVSNGVLGLVLVAIILAVGIISLACFAEWLWKLSQQREILPPPDRAATRDAYKWNEKEDIQ